MAFLALDSRSDLPRVKYATALDLYIALCFVFILSAIVQFAIVHRFTKHGHGDVEPSPTDNDEEDEESEDETAVRIISITYHIVESDRVKSGIKKNIIVILPTDTLCHVR